MKTMQKTFFALGTVNTVMAPYEDDMEDKVDYAFRLVKQKVEDMDDRFSVFKPESEVTTINNQAGKTSVQVSEDTYYVIKNAVKYAQISNGAFDITTRPLSKLWGIGKKNDYIPTSHEIRKAIKLVNYKDIYFEETSHQIGLKKKGQEIDLGGIAKGYAADEAKRILLEQGIEQAVINFGGTIIVVGDEKKVGIQNPGKETGIPMGNLQLANQAIVTSGSYEKYFIKNGVRYHHILNPRTGMPAWNNISGITLVGECAMALDALTTAVFVLGMEAGNQLMQQMAVEGVFICESGEVFITNELKNKFSILTREESCHG